MAAESIQLPADVAARMTAGRQLGSAAVFSDAPRTVLTPLQPFILTQMFFLLRSGRSAACTGSLPHSGWWNNSALSAYAFDGTTGVAKSGTLTALPFGGSSAAPSVFTFEATPDNTLLLVTTETTAPQPAVLLDPLAAQPWQLVSRAAARAAGVAWGVFPVLNSEPPRVLLLYTSTAVAQMNQGAPMVVTPLGVTAQTAPGRFTTAPFYSGTAMCSAGVNSIAFSSADAVSIVSPQRNTVRIALAGESAQQFGADGELMTWMLTTSPVLTGKDYVAALQLQRNKAQTHKNIVTSAALIGGLVLFVILFIIAVLLFDRFSAPRRAAAGT